MSTFSQWLKGAALNHRRRLRSFLERDAAWSSSDADTIRPVLLNWGIRRFRIMEKLGESSATSWLVQTREGILVLRRVRSTEPYLKYQVLVIRHLSASDFPYDVPAIVQPHTAQDCHIDSDGQWLLYRFLEGVDAPDPIGHNDVRDVGTLVGHYDRVIDTIDLSGLSGRFCLDLFDVEATGRMLTEGSRFMDARPETHALGALLTDNLAAILEAHRQIPASQIEAVARLRNITVYNDWHPYNRVTQSGAITGIIDFDSVVEAPRIVDFQNALTYILIGRERPDRHAIMAFFEGYSSIVRLSPAEISLIYPIMLDRLIWLIADIVDEVRRNGTSSREDLGVGLTRLVMWLTRNREEFTDWLPSETGSADPTIR